MMMMMIYLEFVGLVWLKVRIVCAQREVCLCMCVARVFVECVLFDCRDRDQSELRSSSRFRANESEQKRPDN